ncbi:propanediol dehydratase medium subunit [Babesia caballi]|uniref:Propanediol dehydratase medium subunit n=1 Tax=Babesia caballi TaxID=5871 RepID=A0AAV4LYN5_BABCB|nr:propanediol dehydratase medium subunit [Babesia caballi]
MQAAQDLKMQSMQRLRVQEAQPPNHTAVQLGDQDADVGQRFRRPRVEGNNEPLKQQHGDLEKPLGRLLVLHEAAEDFGEQGADAVVDHAHDELLRQLLAGGVEHRDDVQQRPSPELLAFVARGHKLQAKAASGGVQNREHAVKRFQELALGVLPQRPEGAAGQR